MNRKILFVAGITLVLDQITKIIAESVLPFNETKTIIKNFFQFTLCHNEGAAWNLLSNQRLLLCLISIVALLIIYHFIYCFKKNTRNTLAFGFLIGGLCGNFIDRVFFGYVRDFIDFIVVGYDYPVFNFADVAVVIGVVLLIIAILKGEDSNGTIGKNKRYKA